MTQTSELQRTDHPAEIVASFGDAIVGLALDGTVSYWNAAAADLLGHSAEAMLGRPLAPLVPHGSYAAEQMALERIRAGARVVHLQTERLRHDGRRIPVFATFSPILRDGEGITGIAMMFRDLRPEAGQTMQPPLRSMAEGSTVLLVEDDETLLRMLEDILRAAGHNVMVATEGRAALGLLSLHPEVSAIVSDIVMPNGISGLLLAREAQRLRPNLPVLLMSGRPPEELDRLGMTTDFPFITKPFHPEELTSQVRRLMN